MKKTAIWVITPNGIEQGIKLQFGLTQTNNFVKIDLFISESIAYSYPVPEQAKIFSKLSDTLQDNFNKYSSHICIFATGIAVRLIAPVLNSKLNDPSVVVLDDRAFYAVSLVSGHIGGANDLALSVANITGAKPVITTATDVNELISIDTIAKKNNLIIENPEMIKKVNMAFLKNNKIQISDSFNLVNPYIPDDFKLDKNQENKKKYQNNVKVSCTDKDTKISDNVKVFCADKNIKISDNVKVFCADKNIKISDNVKVFCTNKNIKISDNVKVFCTDKDITIPDNTLVLRPLSLTVGMGCNRNTSFKELFDFLVSCFKENKLCLKSISTIATTSVKKDEKGLLELADKLNISIIFYEKQELNSVKNIQNPSEMVQKHLGVKSVCEAAAILASQSKNLIIPKIIKKNATIAVARKNLSFL